MHPKYEHLLLSQSLSLFPLAALPDGVIGVAILGFGSLAGSAPLICLRSSAIVGFPVLPLLAEVEGTPSGMTGSFPAGAAALGLLDPPAALGNKTLGGGGLTFLACSGSGAFPRNTFAGGGLTGMGFTTGAVGSARMPPSCAGALELLELPSGGAGGAAADALSAPLALTGTSSGVNLSFHSGGALRGTSGGIFGTNCGGGAL
jgi:hypothetical protein